MAPIRVAVITASSSSGIACIKKLLSKTTNIPPDGLIVRGCFRSQKTADATAAQLPTPSDKKITYESHVGVDAANIESLREALVGVDRAVLVTPLDYSAGMHNDAQKSINMIQAAKDAGVSRLVHVGSWTVNAPESLPILSSRFLPTEKFLLHETEGSSLEWTVLRGGYFLNNIIESHAASIKAKDEMVPFPDVMLPPIDTRDIGEAAAALVGGDHDTDGAYPFHGQFIECCGPELLSQADIARELSEGIGRKVAYPTPPDLDQWCEGSHPVMVELIRYMIAKEGKGVPYDSSKLATVLGRPPISVRHWAQENKEAFTA